MEFKTSKQQTMKTHFTADDIGKTFATSQEGVTATLVEYDNICTNVSCLFLFSDSKDTYWYYNDGTPLTGDINKIIVFLPSQETPSEADLLRKEIAELKASHEANLRTAVEMARRYCMDLCYTPPAFMNTPDEIIEKILKKPD